jgi:DNA-binding response OmpR family regulator
MLLIITDRHELGKDLASKLTDHRIFTFECPPETGAFYCDKKDTGGVILDCVPDLKAGEALCRHLRKAYPELPILALVSQECLPDLEADMILRDAPLSKLLPDILDFCNRVCKFETKSLSTYFLTVGESPDEVFYMGYPLHLSPRAFTVLRCLFYRHPNLTTTEDLMALCYHDGHETVGNLAVQIHHINERAAKIDPRPLVVNEYGKGYKLRDGIL